MKNLIKNILLFIFSVISGILGISFMAHFLMKGDYRSAGIVLGLFSVAVILITLFIPHHEHGLSSTIKGYVNLLIKKEENETEE